MCISWQDVEQDVIVNCNDDSKISGTGALKLVGYIPFNQGFTKPGSIDLGIGARIDDRTHVLFMMFLHSHLYALFTDLPNPEQVFSKA